MIAVKTLDPGYFFELHPFDLAALLELKFFIVAQLAGIKSLTARGLYVAWIDI